MLQLWDILNFGCKLSPSPAPQPPLINLAEVIRLQQPQIAQTKIVSCLPRAHAHILCV